MSPNEPIPNDPIRVGGPTDKPLACSLGWDPAQTQHPFQSPWFDLRSDSVTFPNQHDSTTFSYVEHPGSSIVVPVLNDGRVVLLRSFRYPIDAWCWEVPAGRLDPGSTPEQTAHNELAEEVGGVCESLEFITRLYIANGFASCSTSFFLATGVSLTGRTAHEAGETINTIRACDLAEAIDLVSSPDNDGDSALALLLAERALRRRSAGRNPGGTRPA